MHSPFHPDFNPMIRRLESIAPLPPEEKAAVLRLGENLADELKSRNVTVNCVLPSIMDTPQNRAAMPKADFTRWVPLEDVAQVILFLLSDAARSVTGASIPVYGRS